MSLSTPKHQGETIRILHVDDDPEFGDLVKVFLSKSDDRFGIETATNAPEALERIASESFDCVVSDYDMPRLNGIEFLQTLREEYPELPFILFTGKGSEEIASDAIAAGVTEYLQKGVGSERYAMLAQRIKNAVQAKRAERELDETLSRVTDAIYTVDTEWRITYVNEGTEAVMGAEEDLLGENLWEQFPEAREGVIWEKFHEAMETQEPTSFEVFYEPLNLWAAATAYPSATGLTVYFQDITEQKDQDETLQYERNRFLAVFEKATDAIVIADDDGRYLDANSSAAELFGLDREEVIGRSIAEFAPEDFDFEQAWTRFHQSEMERGTFPLLRPDGTRRTVEYAASAEIVEGQHLSVLRDVTDRNDREEQLQQTTARLEALYDNSPDMINLLDTDGRFLDVNRRFCQELGYTEAELLGRPIWTIDLDVTEKEVQSLLDDFELDERRKFEGQYKRKDGSTLPVEVHLLRLDIDGADRFLAISRDITDRKAHEYSLERQNERLERFAGIVSHDLRNPLTVAQGRLELASEDGNSEHVLEALSALDRMASLIEDVLALAKNGELVEETQPVELASVAEESWGNVSTDAATLSTDVDRRIEADASRVKQLLENLFRNAVDHATEPVTVTVGDSPNGFYVADDDGPGIPEDHRETVFDMGFSTSDEGTGFGLAIVDDIARAHDWTVTVSESESGGARFDIENVDIVDGK